MDLIPYDFVSAAMMLSNPSSSPSSSPSQPAKGTLPEKRFCNDCGTRALPGKHRYQFGDRWDDEYGTWFVRCIRCEQIKIAMGEIDARLCFGCYINEAVDEGWMRE